MKAAEEKKQCECEDRALATGDAKLGQEERKQQIELNKAKQGTEAAQQAANVEKTGGHQEDARGGQGGGKSPPAAGGGGGGSSSDAKKKS